MSPKCATLAGPDGAIISPSGGRSIFAFCVEGRPTAAIAERGFDRLEGRYGIFIPSIRPMGPDAGAPPAISSAMLRGSAYTSARSRSYGYTCTIHPYRCAINRPPAAEHAAAVLIDPR